MGLFSSWSKAKYPEKVHAGAHSVTGNYRENNEDRVYSDPTIGLFLVADGMGGQQAGEKASQMAVDIIPDLIEEALKSAPDEEKAIAEVIRLSVLDANRQVMEASGRHSEYQSMGTTVVLTLVRPQSVYIAGLGDSRAYLARGRRIEKLTTDHSLAQALVEAGTISAKEAREHRFRNILWKYLGSKEVGPGPDIKILDARQGDRLLLASDGLTNAVQDDDLFQMLRNEPDPQKAAEALVAQALQNNTHDNASCVTIYLD